MTLTGKRNLQMIFGEQLDSFNYGLAIIELLLIFLVVIMVLVVRKTSSRL